VQNATGKPPAINIATGFDANFGTHNVTFQFKVWMEIYLYVQDDVIFWAVAQLKC
jgi:hypothetical protein